MRRQALGVVLLLAGLAGTLFAWSAAYTWAGLAVMLLVYFPGIALVSLD